MEQATRLRADTDAHVQTPASSFESGIHLIPYNSTATMVAVHDAVVSDIIQAKIKNGRYETREVGAIPGLMKVPKTIVLEIGSGVGVISTIVHQTGNASELHCFEADPRLVKLIEATHAANGITTGKVYNQILTSDPALIATGSTPFYLREHFYGSSMTSDHGRDVKETVSVPTRDINEAIKTIKPNVIICDIEGAELGLFSSADLSSVRKIMMEIHPAIIGPDGLWSIFDDMRRAGFNYSVGSKKEVLVFAR